MPKRSNFAGDVYISLKNQILRNYLRPGEKISEAYIEEHFHVSRTPAKQALQKLEEKGLVEIKDGVGTFITAISYQDMKDAYELRCAAEKLAAKKAVYNIKAESLDELEKRFKLYKIQIDTGGYGASYDEIAQADWELHDLILNSSGNRFLSEAVEKATFVLRRYQYSYISSYKRAVNEHLQMISFIRAGDVEGLTALLDEHLRFRSVE